jgi:hypothetical protein
MKQLVRAKQISETNILPKYVDEEILQLIVTGSTGEKYLVSCNEYGIWRCDCKNFEIHGVNEETGSYLCKHVIAAINFLQNHDISRVD